MNEDVNHPDHYNVHPSDVECIDVLRSMNRVDIIMAVKYIWRAEHKNQKRRDIRKAIWHLQEELQQPYVSKPKGNRLLLKVSKVHPVPYAKDVLRFIALYDIQAALAEAEKYLATCDESPSDNAQV